MQPAPLIDATDCQSDEPSTEPLSPELALVDAELARVARDRMPDRPHWWTAIEADGPESEGEPLSDGLRAAIAARGGLRPVSVTDTRGEPCERNSETVPPEAGSLLVQPAEPVPQIDNERFELEDAGAAPPRRLLRRAVALSMLLVVAPLGYAAARLIGQDPGSNHATAAAAAGAAARVRTDTNEPESSRPRAASVYAGQDLGAAINAASSGDTLVVHSGTYPRTTISKQFASPTSVQAASGESVVVRGFSLSSAAFVTIAGFGVDSGSATIDAFELKDGAHDVVIERNTITGSRIGVKFYGRPQTSGWPRRVAIHNNDISGSYIDAVAIDGAYDVTIADNSIHDLKVNGNHNDGVQAWAVDGLEINRNEISFSGLRIWDCTSGCPNQGVMLGHGGDLVNQRVRNVWIEANVIHHWPGIPINLAGTENVKIVNNTAYDSGNAGTWSALSIGTKGNPRSYDNTGLEVWNNIFNRASCCGGGAAPVYCDFNLIRDSNGYLCGANNLTTDPLLVDRLTYRLLPGSPAIDSGVNRAGTPAAAADGESYGVPDRGARSG
jgi:hypothetical protein